MVEFLSYHRFVRWLFFFFLLNRVIKNFIMSSQLPNITGYMESGTYRPNPGGCFRSYYSGTPEACSYSHGHTIIMEASRSSSIYKNDVTQVFGDSLSYNMFIKALL